MKLRWNMKNPIHVIHIIMFIWIIRVPLVYLRSRSADHQCFWKFCWIINKETLITHYCSFWSNLRRNFKTHFWNGCEVFAVENFLLKDQEPSNYSKGTIKFNYSIWHPIWYPFTKSTFREDQRIFDSWRKSERTFS